MPVKAGPSTPTTFRVGSSTPSAIYCGSTKVWPTAPPPGPPTNLTAVAIDSGLCLAWSAPVTTNGTLTGYIVEYTPAGGSPVAVRTNSTCTSYALSGLTSGTTYSVRVAAVTTVDGIEYAATTATVPTNTNALQLNYTAGSWSGQGTAASPFVSSSIFSGVNNNVLPFSFTALRECDVTLTMSHNNVTWNDDVYGQTVSYRINGTAIQYSEAMSGYGTADRTSASHAVSVRLVAGETLSVYVAAGRAYVPPTDRYTSISCTAVTPTCNKEAMLWNGSVVTWSGGGSCSSPYTPNTAAASAALSIADTPNYWGQGAYANYRNAVWIAKTDCTVFIQGSPRLVPDDNSQYVQLLNGGGSWYANSPTNSYTQINEGESRVLTRAVRRGQVFGVWWNTATPDVRIWIQ